MRAAALLLSILAIVGCVQAGGNAAAPEGLGPAIVLEGCSNVNARFAAPLAEAQALVPAGFTVLTTGGGALQAALMWVVGARCTAASVDGAPVGPATIAYAELAVVPPPALRVVDDNVVPVLFAAEPDELDDAFAALGLGVSGGGSVALDDAAPVARVFTAQVGADGFRLAAQMTPPAGGAVGSGPFRVFGVQDGELRSVVDAGSAGGRFGPANLALTPIGSPPLVAQARPAAQGGFVEGFSLTYARTS